VVSRQSHFVTDRCAGSGDQIKGPASVSAQFLHPLVTDVIV